MSNKQIKIGSPADISAKAHNRERDAQIMQNGASMLFALAIALVLMGVYNLDMPANNKQINLTFTSLVCFAGALVFALAGIANALKAMFNRTVNDNI